MTSNYFVAYDLIDPGQNYNRVQSSIQSLGRWYKLQYSLYYLHSSLTADQIHSRVAAVMDWNDKLIVIDATHAITTPLPFGEIDAINNVWFSGGALPYAAAANG